MDKQNLHKIFMFNPPNDDIEVDALFQNRESELIHCIDLLCDTISGNEILAIHGESRTGKSHFLKKLILELKKAQRPFMFHYTNANSKLTARNVLEDIYKLLKSRIFSFKPNYNPESLAMQRLSIIKDLLIDIDPLVTGEREQMICTFTKERINSNEISFSLLPNFVQAIFQRRKELKMGEEKQWIIPLVTNENLIELIKYQGKLILELFLPEKYKTIFLAVDDLDLLCDKPQGKDQVRSLLDLLNQLASDPLFNVIVTLRTGAYHKHDKEKYPLQKIGAMFESDLNRIYKKHLDRYNQGNQIFTDNAINYLLKSNSTEGRIGDFLKNCFTFFHDNYSIYLNNKIIDIPDIKNQVKNTIKEYSSFKETQKPMLAIINMIQNENIVEFNSKDIFSDTGIIPDVFFDRMIEIDSTNKDIYYINTLFSDVIMEMKNNGN